MNVFFLEMDLYQSVMRAMRATATTTTTTTTY